MKLIKLFTFILLLPFTASAQNDADRLLDLAISAYEMGEYESVIKYIDSLQSIQAVNYYPYYLKSSAYLQLTNYDESINSIKKGLEIEPNQADLMDLLIANYSYVNSDVELLRIHQNRFEDEPDDVENIKSYARSLLNMGDFEKGITLLRKVNRLQPDDISVTHRLGFYLKIINETEEGDSLLKEAYHSTDNAIEKALILSDINRLDEAIMMLDSLIDVTPNFSFLHDLKGALLMEKANFKAAKVAFEQAIELQTHQLLTKVLLCYAEIRIGNYSVVEELELLVKQFPQSYTAKVNYCRVLVELGKLEEAKAMIDDVIALKPLRPAAYFVKGLLYFKMNNFDIACENFEVAKGRYFENLYPTENLDDYLKQCK